MGVYYSAVSGYGFVLTHEEYMACGPVITSRLEMADKLPEWAADFEDDTDEFWSAFLYLTSGDIGILTSGSYYGDAYDLQYLVCVNAQSNDDWGFSDSDPGPLVTDHEVKDLDHIREYLGLNPETHKLGYYTGVLQS